VICGKRHADDFTAIGRDLRAAFSLRGDFRCWHEPDVVDPAGG
jgi:hypothetical protein